MAADRPLTDVLVDMLGPADAAKRLRRYFFDEGCALSNFYTAPMLGHVAKDIAALEGVTTTVRTRSVPNVDTVRLIGSAATIHDTIHTAEGLHAFDEPRRGLIDRGRKSIAIHRELQRRGHPYRCCAVIERCLA